MSVKKYSLLSDHGNRENRAQARLKYTIDTHGIDWFRNEVESRLGYKLQEGEAFQFDSRGDRYGWVEGLITKWHYTLFVPNGRIQDTKHAKFKSGLLEIAKIHTGIFAVLPTNT